MSDGCGQRATAGGVPFVLARELRVQLARVGVRDDDVVRQLRRVRARVLRVLRVRGGQAAVHVRVRGRRDGGRLRALQHVAVRVDDDAVGGGQRRLREVVDHRQGHVGRRQRRRRVLAWHRREQERVLRPAGAPVAGGARRWRRARRGLRRHTRSAAQRAEVVAAVVVRQLDGRVLRQVAVDAAVVLERVATRARVGGAAVGAEEVVGHVQPPTGAAAVTHVVHLLRLHQHDALHHLRRRRRQLERPAGVRRLRVVWDELAGRRVVVEAHPLDLLQLLVATSHGAHAVGAAVGIVPRRRQAPSHQRDLLLAHVAARAHGDRHAGGRQLQEMRLRQAVAHPQQMRLVALQFLQKSLGRLGLRLAALIVATGRPTEVVVVVVDVALEKRLGDSLFVFFRQLGVQKKLVQLID